MTVTVTEPAAISVTATSESAYDVTISEPTAQTVTVSIPNKGDKGDKGDPGEVIPTGVDKTIQYNDGGVLGADVNFRWNKNTNTLEIGAPVETVFPNNPAVFVGAVDGYYQLVVQNTQESAAASSDLVVTANNGSDTAKYLDAGINSSVYSVVGDDTGANDSYLLANGGNLCIGTETTAKDIKIYAGGTSASEKVLSVTSSGIVLEAGKTVTNRPEIYYGTGTPPSATGKADGTLFFKYTP